MNEYEVTVGNIFMATSPEDAVAQMTAWLVDNAYAAGYRVITEDSTHFIDAEDIDWNAVNNE